MSNEPNTVLDGGPHESLTVDVSGDLATTAVDGQRYVDTGRLHWHEQHGWLRWFRWQEGPRAAAFGP